MKLKIPFLFIFLNYILLFSQETQSIRLSYDVSGYKNAKETRTIQKQAVIDDALTPTVNAEMSVNDAGALVYQLPIEVLKGVNNHQPNLSLSYNSQSGNGLAGWGWNIAGLSTITRGGKSKDVDGVTIGPQFDESDPYYLDGQRLIKVTDTDYSTEKFSKIKILKSSDGSRFTVKYTDGKIAYYEELLPGQFYIVSIIDAFNNKIDYSYNVINQVPVLVKCSYGDYNANNFFVEFEYGIRKTPTTIFRNGSAFFSTNILKAITISSSYAGLYRKYQLSHDYIEGNTQERLIGVSVSNASGDILKPLVINYNSVAGGTVNYSVKPNSGIPTNTTGLGSIAVGDFFRPGEVAPVYQVKAGSGYIWQNNKGTINSSSLSNASSNIYSGRALIKNKISLNDVFITTSEDYLDVGSTGGSGLVDQFIFQVFNSVTGDKKSIKIQLPGGTLSNPPEVDHYTGDPITDGGEYRDTTGRSFINGDFNNDGLIDFLIFENSNNTRSESIYLLEVGKIQEDTALPIKLGNSDKVIGRTIYSVEFNGDGIPEIMAVDETAGKYSIFKIDLQNNSFVPLLENQVLSNFTSKTPLFFGDFNGDGITDFMTPQKVYEIPDNDNSGLLMGATYYAMQTESLLWWKYIGNGKQFTKSQVDLTQQKIAYLKSNQNNVIKRSTFWQKFWNGKPDEYAYTRYSTHNIMITDFNGDGRSDIIVFNKIGKAKYSSSGNLYSTQIENISSTLTRRTGVVSSASFYSSIANTVSFFENKTQVSGGTFNLLNTQQTDNIKISPLSLILNNSDANELNNYKSGLYIHDPLTRQDIRYTVDNDLFLEKQISSVNNGSKVIQTIEYRPMIPSEDSKEATYLYKPNSIDYPYYIHNSNSALYLVSKIHTLFDDKILTKEYRYENGIQHLEGKGFLGFQKNYMSDAYESEYVDGRYRNKNPSKGVFWNIQTKDPLMENAIVKTTYGGLKEFFSENTSVNKKFDRGNHQYLILGVSEMSQDNLKKIKINKQYSYDEADDLKLKITYTDFNGTASTESRFSYKPESNNGDHFFYGKIAGSEDISYRDGLTFSTREEYDYESSGVVSQNRKYGNNPNAPPIVTDFSYDTTTGNLVSQSISTTGITAQKTSFEYDATKRFITKTTTPDGLFSTANVNAIGLVSSEVSSLGLTTAYRYDSWGNITEITDYLGKKTSISKNADNLVAGGIYNLSKKREGGTETIVTFDNFDREIQTKTQTINGKWVVSRIEYDIFGRKIRGSENFFEGENPKWNSTEYDELGRPVKNIAYTGKTATTCYEGMTVTVDDGYRKVSKTLDATGNVVRQQDHGGVINFKYFPNGELKESNYEGIVTSIEIDGWGNKTKLSDPSAGVFQYEYDNYSRITKEINPKGTTLYTYDTLGRPLTETTTGKTAAENTNIIKTYTYNANTKLPETITGTSNGKIFTYTTYYDSYFRIIGKKEQTPDFDYSSSTTFDSFGRPDVVSIMTKLANPSYTSTSNIKNVYDTNGILIQQNDVDSGKLVWHITSADAQGNTTQMEYGNGYNVTNLYNQSDLSLTNIKHRNINGTVAVDIDYSYDMNKEVLNWRRNNTFSKKEDFYYDKLGRLTTEYLNGTKENEYTYDKRGRITSNTELGKYNYSPLDYRLQNIGYSMKGQDIASERGFSDIAYNAFRNPLQITLPGKDDLNFDYNILKTRYSMTSSVTGTQKLYSSDFAIEITKKNDDTTQIITFITGDPYSANYIKRERLSGLSLTEKGNYFLHRDNLGSILAVSKASDGTVVEQRFFDAWGNLKSVIINGRKLITHPNMSFMDRGYTGHEHLQTLGIINMNARIYDPILRRFLSADNEISDPFNTQAYDRYSYVLNNPLLYIDQSGNNPVVVAILIGMAVGVTTNGIMNMINGIPFWYGMGKAGLIGAVSGAISFGIGSWSSSIFGQFVSTGKALFEAGLHAISGGLTSAVEGGKFFAGALSGFVSSMISSGIQGLGQDGGGIIDAKTGKGLVAFQNNFGQNYMKAAMIVSGGLSGGISSVIAGGNFWQGMRQGLISSGLNHVAHLIAVDIELGGIRKDLTKQFNEQLKKTREFFASRKKYYDNKFKNLIQVNARPEAFTAVAEEKILEFIKLVKTDSPYDIKNNPQSLFSNAQLGKDGAIYNGEAFRVDDFGNYNFGVAAKAYGYSLNFSRIGAGLYQILSGTSDIGWISSYFDDPRDYMMIGRGYNHFK